MSQDGPRSHQWAPLDSLFSEPPFDPTFDVGPAKPDVLADTKPGRTDAAITPGVQRGGRHIEVLRELLDREQSVDLIHPPMLPPHPVIPMPFQCQGRYRYAESYRYAEIRCASWCQLAPPGVWKPA